MSAIANNAALTTQCFPRQYRLTRTDEFSSVFDFRRAIRGKLFMLHYFPRPDKSQQARLGLVIGKKQLKSSVRRNLVKRLARENFRVRQSTLPDYDLILRLILRPEKMDRRMIAEDIVTLLGKLRPYKEKQGAGKTDR